MYHIICDLNHLRNRLISRMYIILSDWFWTASHTHTLGWWMMPEMFICIRRRRRSRCRVCTYIITQCILFNDLFSLWTPVGRTAGQLCLILARYKERGNLLLMELLSNRHPSRVCIAYRETLQSVSRCCPFVQ